MYPFRVFKVIKFVLCVIIAAFLFGWIAEHLWNWLMPYLFNLHTITYWQAIGLLILSKLLFGSFHTSGNGGRGRRRWEKKMKDRWAHMTPEERERFRAGIKSRWGHGCGFPPRDGFPGDEPAATPAQPFTR